jgi:hypothetical protein
MRIGMPSFEVGGGLTLLSCDKDLRVGGKYRLVFSHSAAANPTAC